MTTLQIKNHGQAIVASNYWDSELANDGNAFLSVNAGAFRLMLPDNQLAALADMRTGKLVIISRGPWPAQQRDDAIEVLFDDDSDSPFAIHIGTEQIDRLPLDANVGQQVTCTVWTRGPNLALSLPARYRRSERLPDLRPWRGKTRT
jgi:hypothetical protein